MPKGSQRFMVVCTCMVVVGFVLFCIVSFCKLLEVPFVMVICVPKMGVQRK